MQEAFGLFQQAWELFRSMLEFFGLGGSILLSFLFVSLEVNFLFQIVKLSPWYKKKVLDEDKDFYGRLTCLGLATAAMALHEYRNYTPAVFMMGLLAGLVSLAAYEVVTRFLRKRYPDLFLKVSGKTTVVQRSDGTKVAIKHNSEGEVEAIKEGNDKTQWLKTPKH